MRGRQLVSRKKGAKGLYILWPFYCANEQKRKKEDPTRTGIMSKPKQYVVLVGDAYPSGSDSIWTGGWLIVPVPQVESSSGTGMWVDFPDHFPGVGLVGKMILVSKSRRPFFRDGGSHPDFGLWDVEFI